MSNVKDIKVYERRGDINVTVLNDGTIKFRDCTPLQDTACVTYGGRHLGAYRPGGYFSQLSIKNDATAEQVKAMLALLVEYGPWSKQ